eukprot:gene12035-12178_t
MDNVYRYPSPLPSSQQSHEYGGARTKLFNDSVHGHITLHRASVAIIDTPEFQRLRHLKQLGLTYYIYPGASHNRFEHSLGVAHLATEWGQHLISSSGSPESDGWQLRNFEPEGRKNLTVLQLAGLCHDLGHGPFSHVFEKELLPKLYPGQPDVVKEWHHETMSNKIFDHITSESSNDIDLMDLAGLTECDLALVKALMHGSDNPAAAHPSAPWLYDVVANKRNGIDVDKFDYLLRDSKMCGVTVPLDHERLMLLGRLDRNKEQVIFKMTEYSNLAVGLFQSRAEMHRRVYTHQKVKSIEFMVCDALALAQEPLGLRDALSDISMYLKLDDTLLQRLQWLNPEDAPNPKDVIKAQLHKHCQGGLPTPAQIVGHQSAAAHGVDLVDHLNDIIICETHIDGGMKDANPMDTVRFYQTTDAVMGDKSFAMPQQQVSSMLGTVYQDKKIRVYCKLSDRNIREALKYAFEQWAKQLPQRRLTTAYCLLAGVDIGDIEIIRNAGGRVTFDVVRSLFVAQEVPELATRTVLVVHHTDCGAQAAMRHHDLLVDRMRELLRGYSVVTWLLQGLVHIWSTLFVPRFIRKKLLNTVMRPFADPSDSVKEDVWLLRNAPLMPRHIPIHGLICTLNSTAVVISQYRGQQQQEQEQDEEEEEENAATVS